MKHVSEDNKLLASLAVFRELYNAEKDVYGIISVFLTDLIKNSQLYSFTLNDISDKLNTTFEFDIPPAVIKTSLGRLDFLEKIKGEYVVKDISKIKTTPIDEKQQQILINNESIIDNLLKFIEREKNISLTQSQKDKVSHSFSCFLLDVNNGDEYIEYITAFILQNEANTAFKAQLNLIREGVILYSGIKYNNDLNDLGTWRTHLTIYIETEILFHLAGLNGELYKCMANDFLTYVKEINQKAQNKLIKLKYFVEVKTEIDGFFKKALHLMEGNEKPNPNVTAMVSIFNGCRTRSDILEKKSDFYSLLKSHGIEEDTYKEYFNPINHRYNIVSKEIIQNVNKDLDVDAEEHLKFLNYISIQRQEASSNNFENIGCILLSGNSITLRVAWNDLLKDEGLVPLATHLSFLTNKFWFKLNKGFGKSSVPKSFDIITKSQIILSRVLNDTVGEKFTELQEEFRCGKLSEDQAKARIVDLRNQVRKPEDIKNDIVKDVLNAITEDSLEKFVQEQSHFRLKAAKQEAENIKLSNELIEKQNIEKQLVSVKKDLLAEKELLKETLTRQKKKLDKKAEKRMKILKWAIASIIVFYYSGLIAFILIIGWNVMEPYTYILGLLPVIGSFLYLLFYEETINPLEYLKQKQDRYYYDTYVEFDFDLYQEKVLENEIADLRNQLVGIIT